MNKILSCTDGSLYAPSIYAYTAWAAQRTRGSVHVFHLLDAHRERAESADLSGHIGMDTGEVLLEQFVSSEEITNRQAREQGESILAEAHRQLSAAGIAEIVIEQQHGKLVETITNLEVGSDLVVIGQCSEPAGLAALLPGSHLEQIIRDSVRPVLVVPREYTPITKFLLAYDGGPHAARALEFLKNQTLLNGITCHILRTGQIDAQAGTQLQEAAGQLEAAGFEVISHAIPGEPAKVIAEFIQSHEIPLLVMGAYGHSRLRQWIIGSTTNSLIRDSAIPILMFR